MAALELGGASISEVAARAGLGRTTAYSVIERLRDAGLVQISAQADKRFVIPEEPRVMLQRIEAQRNALTELMPELLSLYNVSQSKPAIRFYEGSEGVLTVLYDTLTARTKKLRGILSMGELLESPGQAMMEAYIKQRVEKGISLSVLRSSMRDTDSLWPTDTASLRELRHAPPEFLLAMTTYVYDDKVAIISSKRENYGLIIESRDFALLFASLFDGLWAISESR
jgi:sugar-specific transcriptional regulator TrmB